MFENGKEDILEYCFRFMISKEMRLKFLQENNINVTTRSLSAKNAAAVLREKKGFEINLKDITKFTREKHLEPDTNRYIRDLKSGLLEGHNWHGAMPSFLHLSFQNKVREYCSGSLSINEYLTVGNDIAKQEFFIVVTHDLCENHVIKKFSDVIPSIAKKSVSDFIFREIPYDLKNSGVPTNWTMKDAKKNPKEFVRSLYLGADTERLRKQAQNSINNWGLNRFYVIVEDISRWLKEPEKLLKEIREKSEKLEEPISFQIEGLSILAHVIFL